MQLSAVRRALQQRLMHCLRGARPEPDGAAEKLLACAWRPAAADNIAENALVAGLRVLRVGRPAAVRPALTLTRERGPVAFASTYAVMLFYMKV